MILTSRIFSCFSFEALSVAPRASSFLLCFQIARLKSQRCRTGAGVKCVMEVPEGVVLVLVRSEPRHGDPTAE